MNDNNNLLLLVSAAVLVATVVVLASDDDSHKLAKRDSSELCDGNYTEVMSLISHHGLTLSGLCDTTVNPNDTCDREINCSHDGSAWNSSDLCIARMWVAGRIHIWFSNIDTVLQTTYMDANITTYHTNGSQLESETWTNESVISYMSLVQAFMQDIKPLHLDRFVISKNVLNCEGK